MATSANLFTFVVSTGTKAEQLKVTVFKPEPIKQRISQDKKHKPSDATMHALLHKLTPAHVAIDPSSECTLVADAHNKSIYIDSQPAGEGYRYIRLRSNDATFAVVRIDVGAEFCYTVGYEVRLLKFLKQGLLTSSHKAATYRVRVKVEKRQSSEHAWLEELMDGKKTMPMVKGICMLLNPRTDMVLAKRLLSATNVGKIAKESVMIEHVAVAIEKQVVKLAEKEGAEVIAKKVPIVSTFFGVFMGAYRAYEGDFKGAFLEIASGVLADIPGPGTAASLAIDVGLMARDIKGIIDDEEEHEKLLQDDVTKLKAENSQIQEELSEILPETPVYGDGTYDNFYNETELANVNDISKIHVRSGDFIEGIQVEYKHGEMGACHGGKAGKAKTMALEGDERITKVEVSTYKGAVSSISFHTDNGRQQSYGKVRPDKQQHEFTDGTYLAAIKGYDMFKDSGKVSKTLPGGKKEVVPAIGFVAKVIY